MELSRVKFGDNFSQTNKLARNPTYNRYALEIRKLNHNLNRRLLEHTLKILPWYESMLRPGGLTG